MFIRHFLHSTGQRLPEIFTSVQHIDAMIIIRPRRGRFHFDLSSLMLASILAGVHGGTLCSAARLPRQRASWRRFHRQALRPSARREIQSNLWHALRRGSAYGIISTQLHCTSA